MKLKSCSFCFNAKLSLKDHKKLMEMAYKNYKYSSKKGFDWAKYWWFRLYYKHKQTIKIWDKRTKGADIIVNYRDGTTEKEERE